jgi:8-oxo-dGTP pyrophosphatase MutT (NUDIX family)
MRKQAFHQTAVMQRHAGVPVEELTDFRTGDHVMTVDGFPGKVTAVLYGPYQASESYQVELDGGMGGGDYSPGQLTAYEGKTSARVEAVDVTAAIPVEASTDHTANIDYPELENILTERLPNENIRLFASKTAAINTDQMGGSEARDQDPGENLEQENPNNGAQGESEDRPDEDPVDKDPQTTGPQTDNPNPPDACSYCGHNSFSNPEPTGRGMRMSCDQCHGTMKSNGMQWEPEFPNSSQNHASETWDYRSGGPGGVVQAPGANFKSSALDAVNSLDETGFVESLTSEAGIVSWMFNRLYEKARNKYEQGKDEWWLPQPNQLGTNIEGPAEYDHLVAPRRVSVGSVSELNDPDWTWHFTATWMDVQEKARRIRKSSGVKIVSASKLYVNAEVEGDRNVYETQLNYVPGTKKVADWSCGCKWAAYAWGRSKNFKKFEGRLCSHALATQYEASAQGIFGREISPDPRRWQDDGTPIIVQHERGYGDRSRPATIPNIRRTFSALVLDSDGIYPDDHQIDLQHAPVYATVQTMAENKADWSTILEYVASTGMDKIEARPMVCEAVLSTFVSEGYSVPAGEGVRGSALSTGASKQQPKHKKVHNQSHDEHPFSWLHSYRPGWGPCGVCAGIGCGNCDAGQVPDSDTNAVGDGGAVDAGGVTAASQYDAFDFGHDMGYDHADQEHAYNQGIQSVHPGDYTNQMDHHMNSWPDRPNRGHVAEGFEHGFSTWHNEQDKGLPHKGGSIKEADYSSGGQFNGGGAGGYVVKAPHSNSQNPASTGWATSQDPGDWGRSLIGNNFGITTDSSLRFTAAGEPPTVSGVALKAADTGRVLMIQRSHKDDTDPAKGTWEFPGGHHEDGDQTSLHAGIREWQEETGQPFPEGGHLTHVHRNGPYLLHTVITPSESNVDFSKGRSESNPDDPDGDDHEQAAWWDPEHAKKNPALRSELKKSAPFEDIKKAASHRTAADPKDCEWCWNHNHPHEHSPRNCERSMSCDSCGQRVDQDDIATTQDGSQYLCSNCWGKRTANVSADGYQSEASIDFESRLTDATLNETPEAALPSTDGAEEVPAAQEPGDTHEEDAADGMTTHSSAQQILEEFQKSAGAKALAADVPGFAKQSMKEFSHAEQQELINEGKGGPKARNFSDLKIAGTHYEMLGDDDVTDETILWV